jgi:chloramphenicol-sensitive protein RarD
MCGFGAYTLWGVFPIYFHLLRDVPPPVVLCHRILWSCLFLAIVLTSRREWRDLFPFLKDRKLVGLLSIGATLIAMNWLIFIYAVGSGQVLQASLGYFINPVFSVALGLIFLREKLRRMQWVALWVAVFAVLVLAVRGSGFPWIALSLALSFGFYGLVRKRVHISSLQALMVESSILAPLAAGYVILRPGAWGGPAFGWLSMSGVLTATPLLLFGAAVRRLKLSTLGFLQYIGPTLQFLLAALVFNEPLDKNRLVSFALCWTAVAIFVIDSWLARSAAPDIEEPD